LYLGAACAVAGLACSVWALVTTLQPSAD
ncbi:MAG: hypothetical protein QG655_3040, partial [Actinomycetota bacterium]|nr:hypothetical protein [Actinomycetota bacterium]